MRTLVLSLCLSMTVFAAQASQQLLSDTQQAKAAEQLHNQQREQGFAQSLVELKQRQQALLAERKALQAETDALSEQFSANEETLAELEKDLHLASGSLGELFGVVRQAAKELQLEVENSALTAKAESQLAVLNTINQARALPSLAELEGLWEAFEHFIQSSGRLEQLELSYLKGDGSSQLHTVSRLGGLGMVDQQGYLQWDGKLLKPYPVQAANAPKSGQLDASSVALDPTQGSLLAQLANQPSLKQRFDQGGLVAKIIAGLFLIGLVIALYRGLRLVQMNRQLKAQLTKPNQPGDNPLGRILQAYQEGKQQSVEALELRLMEQIVDEQQYLERGLSMLKLLAALAPMLGLLGTVTGMIETFQVITQFGNADPKVMASGISMALVTTVLGLVCAMPLLLAHNILNAQAEAIRNVLEKQSLGLVAARAEAKPELSPVSDERAA